MRKEYEVIVFERDGQKLKYNISENELNSFYKLIESPKQAEPQKPIGITEKRYFNLRDMAWEILIASGINSLPVSLEKIAAVNGWSLLSYQQQAAAIAIIDKAELRKQREGFSCELAGCGIVCYDEIDNKGRMRWTIAHEFGHLAMQHPATDIENYEQEAHMFARRLLAPMGILCACEVQSAIEIAKLCEMSSQAAEYAYNRYQELLKRGKFFTSPLEIRLREQFKDFIAQYLEQKEIRH